MFKCNTYIINPEYKGIGLEDVNEYISINDEAAIRKVKDKIDPEYAYGVIVLTYNDEVLFDLNDHDDINWVWGYLLTMIEDFLEKGKAKFSLSTTGEYVSIEKLNKEKLLFKLGERSVVVPTKEFIEFLLEQAKLFYIIYSNIFEEEKDDAILAYKQIDKIKILLNNSENC